MSAATDSRNDAGTGTNVKYDQVALAFLGPIASAVNLPKGTIAAQLASDTNKKGPVIYPFTTSASKIALGFVNVGGDNTSGGVGAFPINVEQRTGLLVDTNAGGGSAIAQTDRFKVAYGVDNQTCSKVASDGEPIGMIMGLDDATGLPVVGVGPMFLALAEAYALASGSTTTITQTYSTTATTVPADTSHTITDSSGGTASTSALASVTTGGGTYPDATPVANNFATLAAELALVKADALATKKVLNAVIDGLQAKGLLA